MTLIASYPTARFQYVTTAIQAGVDFAASELATEPGEDLLRYVRTTDIASTTSLRPTGVYAPVDRVPAVAVASEGDLLLTRAGSLGTSYLHVGEPVAVAGYLVRCQLDASCDPRFYAYYCQSQPFKDALRVGATQTTIENFSASKYAALQVPVPPVEVQRRVADMLDVETVRIDTLIAKNQRAAELTTRRLDASISHHTTLGDESPMVQVGYLADVVTSGIDKHIVAGERPVRLCNYTDIYYGTRIGPEIDFMVGSCTEQEFARLRLQPGDVVATKDSETPDDIGRPAIIDADLPDLVLGYHNVLFRVHDLSLEPEYLYWYLRSQAARDHFALNARGVTRVGLRSDDLAALRVPLPSIEDQRTIATRLWGEQQLIDGLRQKMQRQVELLRLRRQSLITAAVTGQIDV